MKALCPGCERIVEVGEARLAGSHVEIRCPRCGEVERLALAGPRAGAGPALSCPKCGAPRADEEACARCGLVYANWVDRAGDRQDEGHLAEAFRRLEARWTDDEAHARFLEACLSSGALGFAARCYGSHHDEIGKRQLDRLTALAFRSLEGEEGRRALDPRVVRAAGWALFVLLLAGIVVLLYALLPR